MSERTKPGDRIVDAETYAKLRSNSAALATLEAWLRSLNSDRIEGVSGDRIAAREFGPDDKPQPSIYAPTLLALAAQLTPEPKG